VADAYPHIVDTIEERFHVVAEVGVMRYYVPNEPSHRLP